MIKKFAAPWRVEDVRPEYAAGVWEYAIGRPAREHPRYEEAVRIAERGMRIAELKSEKRTAKKRPPPGPPPLRRRGEEKRGAGGKMGRDAPGGLASSILSSDKGPGLPCPCFNPWWVRTWQDVEAALAGCWFDERAGLKVCAYFERFLRFSKGKRFAGKPFVPLDWQRWDLLMPLFGWKRRDGTRRFRKGSIWVPKKNGKSETVAGLGLFMMHMDGEATPEVYSAARDGKQAGKIHEEAARMVRKSPELRKLMEVIDSTRTIRCPGTGGTFHALSADVESAEGLDIHAVFVDELHVQGSRKLYGALEYGGAAREEPLVPFSISTVGTYDTTTVGWEQWEYAKSVQKGIFVDWEYFALIYEAEEEEAWNDPKTWVKANPSLGVTILEPEMAAAAFAAKHNARLLNDFLRRRLNRWTSVATRWLNFEEWSACGGEIDLEALKGRECYVGVDLGSKIDFTAVVFFFPAAAGKEETPTLPSPASQERGREEARAEAQRRGDESRHIVLAKFWLPAEGLAAREERENVPFGQWVKEGWIEVTAGSYIDFTIIKRRIAEEAKKYRVIEVPFDEHLATQLAQELEAEEGLTVVAMRQSYQVMSPGCVELEGLLKSRKLNHGDNPVLTWMSQNVEVKTYESRMRPVKPDSKSSKRKVDGVVALVMALARWSVHKNEKKESVYEKRGIVVVG